MTDMTRAVITMPYELAMCSPLARKQYHSRANSLLKDYDELHKALYDLIRDLEMRGKQGVVDCGNGVYVQAKRALGELK